MELTLKICLLVFFGIFSVNFLLYIPRFVGWFGVVKKQEKLINLKNNKIALIIPARNESKVIDAIIDSINIQSYDKSFFDTYIIVKDRNDKSIEKAKRIGATVHIVENQKCKGDAMDEVLKKILKENENLYDAYFFVDADCVLHEKCLEEMNNALAGGKQVYQTKKLVKNYLYSNKKANSLVSCCNGLIWTIIDDMGNRFKSDNNATIMTIGTGLMIRSDVVKELGGWPYRETLTEDIELMFDCAVKNYSTFYYSHAIVYVEESTSLKVTNKRRIRWLDGVVNSQKIYAKKLLKLKKTPHNLKNIYYTCALIPVYFMVGSAVIFAISNMAFMLTLLIMQSRLWLTALIYSASAIGIIYTMFFLLTLFCIIIDGKYMKVSFLKKFAVLFLHPIFYMGYIPIIAKAMVFKNHKGWEVIDRVEELAI